MRKQIALALTLTVLKLTACNNLSQRSTLLNQTSTNDTLISVNTALASFDEPSRLANDTINADYSTFPIDSTFTTKVLTEGIFHDDEVWDNADKEKWFGLFQGNTGFYIAETKLKTERVRDEILDDENAKTGWEVQTNNEDPSIILIGEQNYLASRNVQQAILSKEQIYPGDTILLNYLGIDYKLYATGEKKKIQEDPEWFDVWNYKLYLTATIKGQEYKSLLVAQPNFDDQMVNLIFAGDIDGDGILDLIIDTSRHYNASSPTIYLSKPATKSEIVKPIGGHTSVGC